LKKTLFAGDQDMQAVTFFSLFVAVLVLFGGVVWLIRRFAGNRLGTNTGRSRMPRLAVIDAAAVDGRRRLVLVRRDNIEHLLMIGGPTDIVVEPNIVRAIPGRDQMPQRSGGNNAVEPPLRIAPLPDTGWGNGDGARSDLRSDAFDHAEPQMPEPPPRPVRPSFVDEARRPAMPERRSDPPSGFTPEPLGSPLGGPLGGRPEPRPELRGEPMPSRVTSRNEPAMPRPPRPSEAPKAPPVRAAAPPPTPAPPTTDQDLAEMAQRLEAALRRPASDTVAPPVAPEPPPGRPSRSEQPVAPPVAAPKSGFENLEDEMASLLGRPKTPS
jgi:hypothetical protein